MQVWEKRQNHSQLTNQEVSDLNRKMTLVAPGHGYILGLCGNSSKQIPSSYQIDPTLLQPVCNNTGNGNKTIVVFGNSHAMFLHSAIAHYFRDVYSEVWTVLQYGCFPLPANQQFKKFPPVSYNTE
jgi:hypothetical protein